AASFTTFINTSWLSVNPISGTAPSALNISADPTGLPASTTPYQGTVTIFGPSNTATVNVTLLVSNVAASPSSLQFAYQMGAQTPVPQSINLTGQATSFSAAVTTKQGGTWLTVTPSGSVPGAVSVSLISSVVAGLAIGTYNATVTITPAGNPPIDVPVALTV